MAANQNTQFIHVRCTKCKNEQDIFKKASSQVKCLVCGAVLATPTGGKVQLHDAEEVAEVSA